MALFSSNNNPSLGSLNLHSFLQLPALPNIVAEWSAILPLVCHLATYRQDYDTAGEVALLRRMRLSLLPKLGRLEGLGRLVESGTTFIDEASIRGGATKKVWDVRWGSVFPCANGAASDVLVDYFISNELTTPLLMPQTTTTLDDRGVASPEPKRESESPASHTGISREGNSPPTSIAAPIAYKHHRYQVLHVLQLDFSPVPVKQRTLKRRCDTLKAYVGPLLFLPFVVALALCGAYGTSALLFCSFICSIASMMSSIERPLGYLESNEAFDNACMLLAPHENSQEWTVLIGQRGIIDTLLNKPMIVVPRSRTNKVVAICLRSAHLVQLLAMTFVAAQKGWDGVSLIALMIVDSIIRLHRRDAVVAEQWVTDSNVSAITRTFLFGSRTVMIGAIELLWGTGRTIWMNDILVPHPRREMWLADIMAQDREAPSQALLAFDEAWARKSADLVRLSAKEIENAMTRQRDAGKLVV